MQLWLVLIALWLWECLAFLPPGGAFVTLAGRRASVRRKPGLFLAAPWPLRLGFALDGLPFEATAERAIGFGPLTFFAATGAAREQRSLPWAPAAASGAVVKLGGQPLLRGSSEASAERIAAALSALAAVPPEQRVARASAALRDALASDAAANIARVRRATLPHRASAALTLAAVAVGVPALALGTQLGWGSVWDNSWPLFAGLHALGFVALVAAEIALRAPGRASRLLRAAVFPPTQWRASSELASAVLGASHPLVCLRAIVPPDEFLPAARAALAECEFPRIASSPAPEEEPARRAALAARRAELDAHFARLGIADELAAAPLRRDRSAGSYCPRCFDEFVAAGWSCTECGLETRPFGA